MKSPENTDNSKECERSGVHHVLLRDHRVGLTEALFPATFLKVRYTSCVRQFSEQLRAIQKQAHTTEKDIE